MENKLKTGFMLERRAVVHRILRDRGEAAVVTGIGNAVHDVASAGDNEKNMYLAGVMGGAVMVAFGIALGQLKRRVLVITGDGEMLAGIGSLAIIGVEKPKNLSIIVIDNEAYGATGNQQTHTGRGVDLVGIAKASGISNASLITNPLDLEKGIPSFFQDPGPYFSVVKVGTKSSPRINAPKDGTYVSRRFRAAMTGKNF